MHTGELFRAQQSAGGSQSCALAIGRADQFIAITLQPSAY